MQSSVPTTSETPRSFRAVTDEAHLAEVEKVLLYVSEARARAARAVADPERSGAPDHLLAPLRRTEVGLEEHHRRLMQGTFYAVPSDQDQLAV